VNEARVLSSAPSKLFIAGEWVDAEDGKTVDVHDPASGEIIRTIADASVADGIRALDAAVEAKDAWAKAPPRVRGEILRRAFDLLQERKEDFALLMTLEMGKPYAEALDEVQYGGEFLRWFSEEAVRIDGRYGVSPEERGE
jgi:succinate-semialdehyde dehydrogenase/glutarate-semialdehyde dehydrogenase